MTLALQKNLKPSVGRKTDDVSDPVPETNGSSDGPHTILDRGEIRRVPGRFLPYNRTKPPVPIHQQLPHVLGFSGDRTETHGGKTEVRLIGVHKLIVSINADSDKHIIPWFFANKPTQLRVFIKKIIRPFQTKMFPMIGESFLEKPDPLAGSSKEVTGSMALVRGRIGEFHAVIQSSLRAAPGPVLLTATGLLTIGSEEKPFRCNVFNGILRRGTVLQVNVP
jgi:hypothetical protein